MRELAIADTVRGYDGTGMFYYKEKKGEEASVWYQKKPTTASQFIAKHDWQTYLRTSKFCVVHNRASTIGADTEENTHPFVEPNVIGVHNGTIHGWRSLTKTDANMDSHAVYVMLNETDPDPEAVGKALGKASVEYGAYSLVWYDHRIGRLRFARNDDRPMTMVRTSTAIWFGSEMRMLEWVLSRNKEMMIRSWINESHRLLDIPITSDGPAEVFDYYNLVDKWGTSYNSSKAIAPYTPTSPPYGQGGYDDGYNYWNRRALSGSWLLDDVEDVPWVASRDGSIN
jgi:hypothetical protein